MYTPIQISQARKQLGELMNEAYYTGKPVQLAKGSKPMAILVGTNEFSKMLKILEAHDPAFADTLALTSNPDAQAVIAAGDDDIQSGNLIPLEKAIDMP